MLAEEGYEALRINDTGRAAEEALGDADQGTVGTDAERQQQHDRHGKAGCSPQPAAGVQQFVEHSEPRL